MSTTQNEAPSSNIAPSGRPANRDTHRATAWTHGPWTRERVAALKALYAEGRTMGQISRALGGFTRNAIIGKVHRLGLPRRRAGVRTDLLTKQQRALVRPAGWRTKPRAPKPPIAPAAPRRSRATAVAPALFEGAARTIATRRDGECPFIADAPSREAVCCGRAVTRGAYCADHAALCYTASKPRDVRDARTYVLARQVTRDQWAAQL